MRFTCSGTVTGWRVAGERIPDGNRNSALIIWRERSSEPGTYDNVGRIELGACAAGQRIETGMNNVYECILDQDDRVLVQPGDIIGIETPGQANGKFRLYFDNSGGPMNYILDSRAPQTINLDDSNLPIDQLVPQISLNVTASTTQITTIEMTDGSTTTSGPTSTEAESIVTSDHTTEMTDGGSITSGPSSTEAATSDHTTEMTDGGTFTSGSSSTEATSIATSSRTTEMTDGGTTTSGPSSTEARSSESTTVNIELTDGSTSTSGLTSTEAATSDHTTVQIIDFTTTSSPRQDDSANNPQDKDNSDTSIAIVGAVVGILLVFISVLLLIIILRRQRSGQKSSQASNDNNNIFTNPVYNGPGMQSSIIIL